MNQWSQLHIRTFSIGVDLGTRSLSAFLLIIGAPLMLQGQQEGRHRRRGGTEMCNNELSVR